MPKNVDGIWLSISNLKESILLHMSNTFLEALLKFQTILQWQFHYGKYYGNHCFSIVWQPFVKHCLKMLMTLDCPYQNWGKTLNSTSQTHFWKLFYNLEQADSDSCIMENTMEITVFQLFDKLPLRLPKNVVEI